MIELEHISVQFPGTAEPTLKDISLTIQKGEFFTFLGPSGCGKTTTLRSITGFLTPVSGSIRVNGEDITHKAIEERNIGMVFQSYALFPTMTVYDNIAFGLKVKKLKKAEIDEKVHAIAKKVELSEEQLGKAVSSLSGGQQQRVAIARALVTEPEILCLDEPLSNLDARLRLQLRRELKRMQEELGITTIYVTHDQEEALTLSDRIAVFNRGSIEQVGTPKEIYNRSATEFVCNFVGDINALCGEIVEKMGLPLEEAHYLRLERLYMNAEPITDAVTLRGLIREREFYGSIVKYTVDVGCQQLRLMERNDGERLFDRGAEVTVQLRAADVMRYGGGSFHD